MTFTADVIKSLMAKGLTRKEAAERVGICDKYARVLLWKAANA